MVDTNRIGMEHISLSVITIGSKELAIIIVWLGENLIMHANQAIGSIDRRGHGDLGFSLGTQKSVEK